MTTTTAPAADVICDAVMAWEGVHADWGTRGELRFVVQSSQAPPSRRRLTRELGHLHGDRVLHIGFPKATWHELHDAGRIDYHPVFPGKPGFASRALRTDADVQDAIALLRINYDRSASH